VIDPAPFRMLGLTPDATLADVRDARRRLALDAHPDRGGDQARMQEINAAFDACVGHLTGRRPLPEVEPPRAPTSRGGTGRPARHRAPPVSRRPPVPRRPSVEWDVPSFTVDALPAEAFEALLVVAATIGEIVDDDPPYVLECRLDDPLRCWCRLELVPDAGASTVSLAVASAGTADAPPAEVVRDLWVEELNRLGRPTP